MMMKIEHVFICRHITEQKETDKPSPLEHITQGGLRYSTVLTKIPLEHAIHVHHSLLYTPDIEHDTFDLAVQGTPLWK